MSVFVIRSLLRAPLQTLVRVLVLALSAALLGAMVLFIGHSLRTMTGGAVRAVPLGWQGPVASAGAAQRLAEQLRQDKGIRAAVPVATAPFAGAETTGSAGVISSGGGEIVALPPRALPAFSPVRMLTGRLRAGEVVLDQQFAATLQAKVGDTVSLVPTGGAKPVRLRVSGIAVVGATDVVFQPLDPLTGPGLSRPPSNVLVMPFSTFVHRIGPQLATIRPASVDAIPGARRGISWQVDVQVAPSALTGSPQHAYDLANRLRNHEESRLTGHVRFVDNLADSLATSAGDALYAEALFVMLAVPGALIGLGLAYLAALGAVARDRRALFLLHARGATSARLLGVAALESVVLAVVAGGLGALLAVAVTRTVVAGPLAGWVWVIPACAGVAFIGAFAARFAAGRLGSGEEGRPGVPLWQRLWLDVIALGVSGLVYWLTARTGFSAVLNPDSNPTLSLSIYMFLAPALLWIGTALLLVRLRGRLFSWLAPARATTQRGYLVASATRRAAAVNRGLVLVALLLAFAVDLAVFTATWDQQARVDAQLTLGADVVVSGGHGPQPTVASTPGVLGTTALDHTYAYVGPDLQDTFAIDATTFTNGTALRDSYFVGGGAKTMLSRLRSRPDAILVSKETVTDYSLREGDLLKLRTLDHRNGSFKVVPFHVVGIVQEFPSAPRDSFMVANLEYVLRVTHDPGPNVVFARTGGDPAAVARRVATGVTPRGARVSNIRDATAQTVSSITTVDLRGISRIETAFTLILVAAAIALYSGIALVERRQEFATMAALGKSPGEIASFVSSELALVVGAASLLATFLGWLLAQMLVAMLRHAFDPPPDRLALPWGTLATLLLVTVASAVAATIVVVVTVRRLPVGVVLREE